MRKLLKHDDKIQKGGKELGCRQAVLLGWNPLHIQQSPTNFNALISLLDCLPGFAFNTPCKFPNAPFLPKRETKATVWYATALVLPKALWLLFKSTVRVIQGIFSLLEGCKMPFSVLGWRKACLGDEMLHENTCDLSWVLHPTGLLTNILLLTNNEYTFLPILRDNAILYFEKRINFL